MKHWKVEVLLNDHGEPVQATLVTLVDAETVRVTTQAVEPFRGLWEVLQSLIDGVDPQLRML